MNAPPGRQTRPAGNRPSNAASVNTPADNRSVPNDRDNSEPDALFVLERNAYGLHLAPIVDHANRDLARGLDTALERRYAGAKLVEDATDAQGIAVVDQAIRVHGEMYGEASKPRSTPNPQRTRQPAARQVRRAREAGSPDQRGICTG